MPWSFPISRGGRPLRAMACGLALLLSPCACVATPPGGARLDARSSVEFKEHFRRGLELYRQGLAEGALAEFKQCLEINPEDADLEFQVGRILMERALGKEASLGVAAERLEYAVRLDPRHTPARRLLARLYGRRSPPGTYNPHRAAALYEELLEENPDWEEIRTEYARWIADEIR